MAHEPREEITMHRQRHAMVWNSSIGMGRSEGGWVRLRDLRHRIAGYFARRRHDPGWLLDRHWDAAREQLRSPSHDSALEQTAVRLVLQRGFTLVG